MSPYDALADALVDVAEVLLAHAGKLRDLDGLEPDDDRDARKRATARERMRRYRARNGPRNSDAGYARNSDAAEHENSSNSAPRYDDRPLGRSVGRNEGEGDDARNSDANSYAGVTRDRDAQPSSPWRIDPPTDDERELGRARVRELSEQLRERRKP